MKIMIFMVTIIIATTLASIISKKGNLGITVALGGGVAIGIIAGIIVSLVDLLSGGLNKVSLTFLEITVVLLIGALAVLSRFYRDPERNPPNKKEIIVSPAEGKIIYIRKVKNGRIPSAIKGRNNIYLKELTKIDFINGDGHIIGIDMSILDVHVNRAPISGKVVSVKYTPGKFISLKKKESETFNERNTMVISNEYFSIALVQIASRLVRKIDSYIKKGDYVKMGQRIGIIKFGSQVDIILPSNIPRLKIKCNEGEKVQAGASIIAEYEWGDDRNYEIC